METLERLRTAAVPNDVGSPPQNIIKIDWNLRNVGPERLYDFRGSLLFDKKTFWQGMILHKR